MNWRLILGLAVPLGILLGLDLALDWPTAVKRALLLVALVLPVSLFGYRRQAAFANGFYTGLLTGLVAVVLLLLLWTQFSANNADMEKFSTYFTVIGWKAVTYSIFGVLGTLWGLFTGCLSLLLAKLLCLPKNLSHWSRLE